MEPVALDFETCCFTPGWMAPLPVCASTYHPQDGTRLWATDQLPELVERLFGGREPILGHGFAYDACVVLEHFPDIAKLVFDKYEANEVYDSIDTERIIEIATDRRGKLALDQLASRYGVQVTKSGVRTDFGWLYGRPISEYPKEHQRYVGGDSAELYTLWKRQMQRGIVGLKDLGDLVRGSLWLRLSANYGIRTDPTRVHLLESSTQEEVDVLTMVAQCLDDDGRLLPGFEPLMRGNILTSQGRPADPTKWFSRDTKAIKRRLREAYGEEDGKYLGPLTDGGDASMAKVALDESGDWLLEQLSHLGELLAVRNKDVKMLKQGVYAPIHTRYGYAATTRTTSSAPNLQNFRKKKGIRECLMPREGCCFVETDYPSLELFTLAQVCAWKLGRRDLVTNMNNGRDYHAVIAEGIFATSPDPKYRGMKYDEIMKLKSSDDTVKNTRDCGKYGNYGLCGYMTNPETFALYVNMGSRTEENPRGVRWTPAQARDVMSLWRKNALDPVAFLHYIDTLKNGIGKYDVEIPGTTITRRGCTRTAAANTHFQGLGATVARRAGWLLARRQYAEKTMPGRTVLFCHDAFLAECALADRDAVALAQEECMAQAMSEICPDMRIVPELEARRRGLTPGKDCCIIDSAAQDHYSKFAKSKRDEKGSLIVCRV